MIEVYITGKGWTRCEHQTWEEVQKNGWILEGVNINKGFPIYPTVTMSRNGYINSFREVEDNEMVH